MPAHKDLHFSGRSGWLRAAVLGANDGLLSTASIIVGVAAASSATGPVLVAGLAGLVAGALSMAAGEYVSVSSQADSENADLAREAKELERNADGEFEELVDILKTRGMSDATARRAATEMTEHDALATHAREEIGLSDALSARPLEAAAASAAAFLVGGLPPLLVAALVPFASVAIAVSLVALAMLFGLGAVGARLGGAPIGRAALRVAFCGVIAMAVTYAIGALFGTRL
ncbi:VIT family protein [Thiosulfatihalobacter marinus]|uniref:VIT1/CCC1 transporter family protein n=1 Tax=Thiosulfatihalobacter marinus TaxID=2792481 RepID=UPI0018D62828|nr:VIT family protein [Thiosulfatihalobacter marinus]